MRLIDADAIHIPKMETGLDDTLMRIMIANTPTVDAVEVVRCKECRHWLDVIDVEDGIRYGECEVFSEGHEFGENWFCKDGERRGERKQ